MQDYIGHVVMESLGPDFPLHTPPLHMLQTGVHDDTRDFLQKSAAPDGAGGGPRHTVRTNLITGDQQSRVEMLHNIGRLAGGDVSPGVRETVIGYDALFPGTSRTAAESVAEGADSGARQLMSGAVQGAMQAGMEFFSAARGGFARGVIFGRAAEGNLPPLADLRWRQDDAGTLQLELLPAASRQWTQLGSFFSATVNQALRYAADRRVVAVTMMSGEPFARLEIQLNPELLDTPLGCRVITIDRFVDTLDSKIHDVYEHRRAIEKLRVLMDLAALQPKEVCSAQQAPTGLAEMLKVRTAVLAQFADKVRAAIKSDPASQAALTAALACGGRAGPNDIIWCLCAVQAARALYLPNDVTSQVRERAFTPDAGFSWMRHSEDSLGNVEFWLHMTLAWRSKDGQPAADSPGGQETLAVDFADEDLSTLNRSMPDLVKAYVTSPAGLGMSYDSFMRPIDEFVVLQRFFRLALDSKFGPSFPKQKLVQLERDTRRFVKKQVTLRWQVQNEKQAELLKVASPGEYKTWRSYIEANHGREVCEAM